VLLPSLRLGEGLRLTVADIDATREREESIMRTFYSVRTWSRPAPCSPAALVQQTTQIVVSNALILISYVLSVVWVIFGI